MSQGPLCPNLSQKVQNEVSQMANRNLSRVILLGGLSVNLNHLKTAQNYTMNDIINNINDKNSPVTGWGGLSKKSNVNISKEWPTHQPTHTPTHQTIHPLIGVGV